MAEGMRKLCNAIESSANRRAVNKILITRVLLHVTAAQRREFIHFMFLVLASCSTSEVAVTGTHAFINSELLLRNYNNFYRSPSSGDIKND
jgi:hypothetical protein